MNRWVFRMNTGQEIRYLRRNPPCVAAEHLQQHISDRYGISGKWESLSSERDQNHVVHGATARYVVKVCNQLDSQQAIQFQLHALQRIAVDSPHVPVPRVIVDRDQQLFASIKDGDGQVHCVYVLSYLDGTLLSQCQAKLSQCQANAASYQNLGKTIAHIDLGLRGYFHPAADQDHPWNMHRCLRFAELTHCIAQSDARKTVDTSFAQLQQRWPMLQRLRHQVIYQDAHANNVLLDADDSTRIAGIIDFGDMTWGSLATELAIACDGVSLHDAEVLSSMSEIVYGYDQVLPLEENEVDGIYDMMCARQALSASISAARLQYFPEEANGVESWQSALERLDTLLTFGASATSKAFRDACRFPATCSITPASALRPNDEADDEADLVAARHQYLSKSCKHFYDTPLHFERARGVYLYGTDGHAYLDTYNNVPQVGHCHPHVVNAIARQAAALNTNTRYLYSSVVEYARRLTEKLAPHLDTCLFVNSGSEANDIAWQMAQVVTGQNGALLMEDAYHGITEPIRQFSPGHPSVTLPPHLRGLTVPDPYRGPFRDRHGDIAERYAADADRAITELNDSGHGVAAFMIDSAFCSSGVTAAPDGYLQGVERRVREAGGLMICDEVQSGFGRMGQWWGHEFHGVKADIVTMGKPVGNGHPLGVVVTRREILERFNAVNSVFSTFGGNTVASAAGNAVLDVIERENLIARGVHTGDYFRERLCELAQRQALIGDVRGHGMLIGLEFVTDRESRQPATKEVAALLESMRAKRILVGSEGRDSNIFKLRPCLVFEEAHVDQFVAALDASLNAL